MKSIYYPIAILIINCLLFLAPGCSASGPANKDSAESGSVKQVKLTKFELQSSALITSTGEEISKAGYRSNVYWFPVNVPSTVLTGLVANNVYPDPYS